MCERDLKTLLAYSGDDRNNGVLETMVAMFLPLIKKCAKQLNYDGAESYLIIGLIEFIAGLDSAKVDPYSEGELVNYIAKAVKNKKIALHRRHALLVRETAIVDWDNLCVDCGFENKVLIQDSFAELTKKQRDAVIAKFFFGYSDIEIAKALKISRQAVCRLIKRALKALCLYWVSDD